MYNLEMRRLLQFTPIFMILVLLVVVLVYLAGLISVRDESVRFVPFDMPTAVPPLPGTPVAPFAQLNPSIVEFLNARQPNYGAAPLDALGPEVKSVGAFLPRMGNTLFTFTEPTLLPTPLPYPTSPPLPLPGLSEVILPTVSLFNEDGTLRVVPYDQNAVECAPEGIPVDGVLTQRYHLYHSGIDIGSGLGTPVIATHSGQVIFAGWSDIGYGYLVILQSGTFITYYAHNTSFNVSEGQFIGKGSVVAWSGSTGNSTGPHVHYETRINDIPVDPLTFGRRAYPTC